MIEVLLAFTQPNYITCSDPDERIQPSYGEAVYVLPGEAAALDPDCGDHAALECF
jgi:hypothetical protein